MSKKVCTTIYLDPGQKARLQVLSERTKVPFAEYVRQGLDLLLAKYQQSTNPNQYFLPGT